jgi:hypothetical protein
MKHKIYYTFYNEEFNDITVDINDYEFVVEDNLQDIVEYMYELKFNKKYNYLNWYLESGSREFIKDLQEKWWKNEIDTITLHQNFDFKDWIKDKYYLKALNKASLDKIEEKQKAYMSHYGAVDYEDFQ